MARAIGYPLLAVLTMACCGGGANQPKPPAPPLPPPLRAAQTTETDAMPQQAAADETAAADGEPDFAVSETGLGTVDLQLGTGAGAETGDRVVVHYVGRLGDGTVVDSSRERDVPFTFELGGGLVIPGWDEGVVGMRVGGMRRLIVPPSLAYGARGAPPKIPPEAILEFDIELLGVE